MDPLDQGAQCSRRVIGKQRSLTSELEELCKTHAMFSEVGRGELSMASNDLIRYRFKSLEAAKRSTREARRFFLGDLLRVERKGYPDIASLLELFDHLPANTHLEQPDERVRFAEIDIPRSLLSLAHSLSGIRGVLRPEQSMCNWIQRELANGVAKIPSYRPYLVPKLSSPPWFPNKEDRRSIYESWPSNSRQAKRKTPPQELPTPTWMLYLLRFLLAAECCGAFVHFGGLSDQLNLVAIVLNLCIAESVNLGLSYFRILSSKLEENARMRVLPLGSFALLLNTEQLDVKEQARREAILSARDGAPPQQYKKLKGQPTRYSSKACEEAAASTPNGEKRQFFTQKGAQGQCSEIFPTYPI